MHWLAVVVEKNKQSLNASTGAEEAIFKVCTKSQVPVSCGGPANTCGLRAKP
jgi:hypothetical protein